MIDSTAWGYSQYALIGLHLLTVAWSGYKNGEPKPPSVMVFNPAVVLFDIAILYAFLITGGFFS